MTASSAFQEAPELVLVLLTAVWEGETLCEGTNRPPRSVGYYPRYESCESKVRSPMLLVGVDYDLIVICYRLLHHH